MSHCRILILSLAMLLFTSSNVLAASDDPLPSWKDGKTKRTIVEFVQSVTKEGGKHFVNPEDRIAVFDNDGTLWCEKPLYPQFVFCIDRAREVVDKKPELKERPIFESALKRDFDALALSGAKGMQELVIGTHTGMTVREFEKIVKDWIKSAKHPRFKRKYTECIYQPMLEVLSYFRRNGFKTYIVSGGGRDFMRPWCKSVYGVKPEQVVGSSAKLKYRVLNGNPSIYRSMEIDFLNDGPEKPVGIQTQIGKVPIAAFGNSDGDLQMLQWTSKGSGPRLCTIIRHTDAKREYAYDKDSKVGHLEKALLEAKQKDWLVVDMKKDWNKVFAF